MTHLMEVSSELFTEALNGNKRYIIVKNERPYANGDALVLQVAGSSDELIYKVSSVDSSSNGLKSGYCIISFEPII
jgi:SOS-response transcriptional repressor LexA